MYGAEFGAGDEVIEIGPGLGILTEQIARLGVTAKLCKVSCRNPTAAEHSVEVMARCLYEAVGRVRHILPPLGLYVARAREQMAQGITLGTRGVVLGPREDRPVEGLRSNARSFITPEVAFPG